MGSSIGKTATAKATALVQPSAKGVVESSSTMLTRRQTIGLLASGCVALSPRVARAATDNFYQGKTIDLTIGFPPGASNDLYARRLAAHLPRFIPGNPTIIPRNMPGAGSLSASARMYNIAPKDGTSIGIMAPTSPLDERLGSAGIRFKSAEFGWLGRVNSLVNIIFVRSESIKSINEAFSEPVRLAATGAGSAVTIYPNALNRIVGTRFELIMGYSGSAESMLAVNRKEAEGHCTGWDTLKTSHPDWIKDGSIRLLVQFAVHRHPELPNVPTALELAKTPRQQELMKAVLSASEIGMSFFTTPGVPGERLSMLQTAFTNCMQDAEFKADLAKLNIGLSPLSGQAVAALVADVANVPDALIPELQQAYSITPPAK